MTSSAFRSPERKSPPVVRLFRFLAWGVAWSVAILAAAWAVGALVFDSPLGRPGAIVFAVLLMLGVWLLRGKWAKLGVVLAGFAIVLGWWLTLQPRNDRDWQPDVSQEAWADIQGDEVTFHNVRNCDYRSETDFTPRWETRKVNLSKLTGIDMAITYWGSPYMAHPIVSFQFEDAPPICFSIETRKESGEEYSAIGGLYRQYELVYIVADERDVVRLRTNFRKGEDVYLYRLQISPENARERFMDYVTALNQLRGKPQWYNAVTTNCTTSIRNQRAANKRLPWDWRMLVNGLGDQMLYDRGALQTGGQSFAELKAGVHVNARAQTANDAPDFSQRIRAGSPGFGPSATAK